jgi:uncharacterized protein (TIGR00369 family)
VSEPDAERLAMLARLDAAINDYVPHNRALGMKLVDFGADFAVVEIPWAAHLVGNPETGVLHGGAITTLMDATCGASVYFRMGKTTPIATLDLRIDYLKPALPQLPVRTRATCYRLTRNVAFTRALAYHADENDPIASAAGCFMIATKGRSAFGGGAG